MCGIAGFVNCSQGISAELLKGLQHRGPDAQNSVSFENVTFAHTRLAIQDVSHASQPMHYEEYSFVYNGEIYNHLELRAHLGEFSFSTHSDTETLLYLLIKYQEKALGMLDGMFAFALLNKKTKKIFFARDRSGKKPLYYFQQGEKFVFSSELNALSSVIELDANEAYINEYLRLGFFYQDHTPYQNVKEFPSASYGVYDVKSSTFDIQSYWRIEDAYETSSTLSFEESLTKVDELLQISVKRRLESSDLEVGAFLSGGIDSGLITAIAAKERSNLKTFTVSFTGEYDEAPLAKEVALKYATDHHELHIDFSNLPQDIETILGGYGEPFFDSSAIPSYYVSKEAKEHVTVILNGDGADEIFGGYRRYVPFSKIDFFKLPAVYKKFFRLLLALMPLANQKKSFYNYLYRLTLLASKSGVSQYISTTTDIFEDYEYLLKSPALLLEMKAALDTINASGLDGMQKLMLMDFKTILNGDLLVKMDIATMAHSLEGRSPFLSKELLAFAPSLPSSYHVQGKTTKRLLRELAKKYLPENIINQPKRGFEIPLKNWVNHDLKNLIHDSLGGNAYVHNYIEKSDLQKLLDNSLSIPAEKRAKMLWTLLSLELWHTKNFS